MKNLVIALWVACIASFFLPASTLTTLGQRLFWGILIVHAIECVVFLPKLRRAGGSLAHHLAQTMVFGLFYARGLGGESRPGWAQRRIGRMWMTSQRATSLVAVILAAAPALAADPREASGPPSAEEIRREALTAINKALTDPISEIWSIGLQSLNFRVDPGRDRGERWSSDLLFTGAFPVALTPDWNLVNRTSMFLFHSQLHPEPHERTEIERTTAFGDIVLVQLVSPSKALVGRWLLGAGPAWIFPSGTSRWTTTGKWQVGPAAAVGYLSDKWILGALVENFMSFAGSGPNDTNSMSIQPIAGWFFRGGWSVGYSGNILSNFNAALPEDRWTVPIGVQLGKVTLLGSVPVKVALDAQWMPIHPERFGQTWSVGLVIQAVRPKLLRGYLSEPSTLKWRWQP